jgi:hypothetical protein
MLPMLDRLAAFAPLAAAAAAAAAAPRGGFGDRRPGPKGSHRARERGPGDSLTLTTDSIRLSTSP